MHRQKLMVLSIMMLAGMAGSVQAHPSTSITVRYDAATAQVAVEAQHAVKDETTHYISKLTIQQNGKQIIVQDFSRQANKQAQRALYVIPGLTAGDELAVTTTCNKYGTQTVKTKVE
jgi:outer membrane receptor for Fe3+-dicitrate